MLPEVRAKNAAFLCCHFAKNLAYYNVAINKIDLTKEGFWLVVTGNFIDVCVLEWCKLFGNRNGKYHWKNVLKTPDDFKYNFLNHLGLTEVKFQEIFKQIKNYRDDFVAHSEEDETTKVPCLTTPYLLTIAYYSKLQQEFPELLAIEVLPKYLDKYYDFYLKEAEEIFSALV